MNRALLCSDHRCCVSGGPFPFISSTPLCIIKLESELSIVLVSCCQLIIHSCQRILLLAHDVLQLIHSPQLHTCISYFIVHTNTFTCSLQWTETRMADWLFAILLVNNMLAASLHSVNYACFTHLLEAHLFDQGCGM